MENPKVASSAAVDSTVPGEAGTFSMLRVFVMLVIAVIVAGAGYGMWVLTNSPKGLIAYTGRVLYQGKPVVGSVMTQNLDDKFDSAGGNLDEDGRFTLDTNGEPGANVGRHKLAIVSFEGRGAPPQPLVPAAYTGIATTPLVIEVTGDPAKNKGEFILEGSAPAAGRPAPDSSSSAPPSAVPPSSPGPPSSAGPPDVSPPLVEPDKP